ncbi:hypothetical protein D9M72_532840 [compost metagenome]
MGNQVPSPYQANRVAIVARANSMLTPRYGARSRDEKPDGSLTALALPAAVRAAFSVALPVARTGASVSGRYFTPRGTTITRASTATRNMACQPKAGISWMPTRAAMDPPIGTPDIIRVAMVDRHLVGTSSATRAFAEGTSPPSPMPARSRRPPKTAALGAKAQRAVKIENTTAQPRMVRRRPHESAIRPAKIAPIIMPRKAMEPMVPAVALFRPQPVSEISEDWTVP